MGENGPLFIPISGHTAQECHLHLTLALNVTHKIVPHTSVGRWVGTDVPTYVYNFTYLYLMCLKSIPHSSYLYLSHSFSFTMYTNKHTHSLSLPHKSTHFNSHPLLHVYHNMELLVKEESLACHKIIWQASDSSLKPHSDELSLMLGAAADCCRAKNR